MNFIQNLIKKPNVAPQQQLQQQQLPNQYYESNDYNQIPGSTTGELCRLHVGDESEKSKPLMAVIVTLNTGSSFDSLFESKKQEPPEGGRVSVWKMPLNQNMMKMLREALDNRQQVNETLKELFEDLDQVEPGSCVFNFECCGGCSESGFGGKGMNDETVGAIGRLLHFGFFVMASDFSLKALLAKWDKEILGDRPFMQVGGYSSSCELRFVPGVLKECASAQLVTVGQLCENGEAHVHAMGGTIAYAPIKGINWENDKYTLELLTVITKADGSTPTVGGDCEPAKIKDHSGYAGHSMLTYKTGGNLLLSCHWMELSHLSTSEENVFKTYETNQGMEYANQKRSEYNSMPLSQRSAQLQNYAQEIVQTSAPCRYMKK